MRTCWRGTSGCTDLQKKVALDWPHPQKTCQEHHQAGSDLESTRNITRQAQTWNPPATSPGRLRPGNPPGTSPGRLRPGIHQQRHQAGSDLESTSNITRQAPTWNPPATSPGRLRPGIHQQHHQAGSDLESTSNVTRQAPTWNPPATSPGRLRPGIHQQRHQAGSDLESTWEETEGPRNTRCRHTKAEMLRSGHFWKELEKTVRCTGRLLSMAYAPYGAKGLSKQLESEDFQVKGKL